MKTVIRSFFKLLRIVLGPFMLLWEIMSRPPRRERPPAAQARVDQECRDLVLYQYRTCPFCIKVRKEMYRLALNIECRDAQREGADRQALLAGGGQLKVPCLKVTDATGSSRWIYESSVIMAYLRERFADA